MATPNTTFWNISLLWPATPRHHPTGGLDLRPRARTSLGLWWLTAPVVVIVPWGAGPGTPGGAWSWPSSAAPKPPGWTRPGSPGASPASPGRGVEAVATRTSSWHLHLHPHTTQPSSIQSSHWVFSIPGVLKLDKGKPRRVACHPHIDQRAILGESWFQLMLGICIAKVPHIHFALGPHLWSGT